jgi:hypothetical protein
VVFLQDRESFVAAVFGDQPTGRFRTPPHEGYLAKAGHELEQTREPPSPSACHLEGAVGGAGRNYRANEPASVEADTNKRSLPIKGN